MQANRIPAPPRTQTAAVTINSFDRVTLVHERRSSLRHQGSLSRCSLWEREAGKRAVGVAEMLERLTRKESSDSVLRTSSSEEEGQPVVRPILRHSSSVEAIGAMGLHGAEIERITTSRVSSDENNSTINHSGFFGYEAMMGQSPSSTHGFDSAPPPRRCVLHSLRSSMDATLKVENPSFGATPADLGSPSVMSSAPAHMLGGPAQHVRWSARYESPRASPQNSQSPDRPSPSKIAWSRGAGSSVERPSFAAMDEGMSDRIYPPARQHEVRPSARMWPEHTDGSCSDFPASDRPALAPRLSQNANSNYVGNSGVERPSFAAMHDGMFDRVQPPARKQEASISTKQWPEHTDGSYSDLPPSDRPALAPRLAENANNNDVRNSSFSEDKWRVAAVHAKPDAPQRLASHNDKHEDVPARRLGHREAAASLAAQSGQYALASAVLESRESSAFEKLKAVRSLGQLHATGMFEARQPLLCAVDCESKMVRMAAVHELLAAPATSHAIGMDQRIELVRVLTRILDERDDTSGFGVRLSLCSFRRPPSDVLLPSMCFT